MEKDPGKTKKTKHLEKPEIKCHRGLGGGQRAVNTASDGLRNKLEWKPPRLTPQCQGPDPEDQTADEMGVVRLSYERARKKESA